MNSSGIAISAIEVNLGRFRLGPVSLNVENHQYLTLMGPSGCGKTTLLKCIAGFVIPEKGRIELGGRDITELPPHKRMIGYVSQADTLFPHLTVKDNVLFGVRYAKDKSLSANDRLTSVSALTGIGHLLASMPHTLSGGEAKRVALARSLIIEPELLILDEPLSMLDKPSRTALINVLKDIHRKTSIPVIHVTHQSEDAVETDSICGLMANGLIIRTGGKGILQE